MDVNIESMKEEERRWFANAIAGMICADGVIANEEMAYLKEAISFLGDTQEINELVRKVKKKQEFTLPNLVTDVQLGFTMLKHVAGLSISDGQLANKEMDFFKEMGKKIGFPKEILERILKAAQQRTESDNPIAHIVGNEAECEVVVIDLTLRDCTFRCDRQLTPSSKISLRVKNKQDGTYFEPLSALVIGNSVSKADSKSYVIKTKFQQAVVSEHGVHQTMDPEKYMAPKKEKKLESKNNSLMGKYVDCFVCGHQEIPAWVMRSRSMLTKQNIFGVSSYTKPVQGQDFIDYNIAQITVCPSCCFSSGEIHYFSSMINKECPFRLEPFKKIWLKDKDERLKRYQQNSEGFASENRTFEQGLLSYDFAVEAYKALIEVTVEGHDAHRKLVSYYMIMSEMAMSSGQRETAEKLLDDAVGVLTPIFEDLDHVPILRSAKLLALIHLYFRRNAEAGKYLRFFSSYDRDGKFAPGTDQYKEKIVNKQKVDDAFSERDSYAKENLKSFYIE